MLELLCVIAIIAILLSMMLPAVARAYRRVKAMSEEMEEPQVAFLLRGEVRKYCADHTQYHFDGKSDFEDKCALGPKCRDWIEASYTLFIPFNNLDSSNKVVVSFHFGRDHAQVEDLNKGELTMMPRGQ